MFEIYLIMNIYTKYNILRMKKFLAISPLTAFQAHVFTGWLL